MSPSGNDALPPGSRLRDRSKLIEYFQLGENNFKDNARRILRPANYPAGTPGWGLFEGKTRGGVPFAVINLQGRVFMAANDDPFRVADALLQKITAKVIVVDMHAEA